jgi:hypothetical protein
VQRIHQAHVPANPVIHICANAPVMKARVPCALLSLGSKATRATTSPERLGVIKAQDAPIRTSLRDILNDSFLRINRCHFKASMSQLIGIAKIKTNIHPGRGKDSESPLVSHTPCCDMIQHK